MKQKLLILFISICCFGIQKSLAQDHILLRGKEDTLHVKILEIGVDEIRYRLWPEDITMPVMVEKKERIRKIILVNGTIIKFSEDEFSNVQNYVTQKKMVVKIDLFSPIRKVLSGSFEYSIKPGMSMEAGIGIIGIGSYSNDVFMFTESNGGFVRLGFKFINQPDFHLKGMRYTHILKGSYIRPELMYIYHENFGFNSTINSGLNFNRTKINGAAFLINFGKQWVFSDIFCVDLFVGPGIGMKELSYYNNGNKIAKSSVNYGFLDRTFRKSGGFGFGNFSSTSGDVGFCLQAGLKLGVLIGAKEKD